MLTIYKSATGNAALEVLPDLMPGTWVDVSNPGREELAQLEAEGVPADFLTYALDLDERPRTEKEDGVILILMRIPCYLGEAADVPYSTVPLGIILTSRLVVTLTRLDGNLVQQLLSPYLRQLSTAKRNRFVLLLFLAVANRYLAHLREIDRAVDVLEDSLLRSLQNRELQALLKYQKSLVYFTTALRSNELMMERLQRSHLFQLYPEDEDLLDDVLTENQQAIEMTAISSDILSSMMDAFASIISNNLNVVMKFLASITVVLTVPTMIASFYGMNVALPLQEIPYSFWLILGVSMVIVLSILALFWRRNWL